MNEAFTETLLLAGGMGLRAPNALTVRRHEVVSWLCSCRWVFGADEHQTRGQPFAAARVIGKARGASWVVATTSLLRGCQKTREKNRRYIIISGTATAVNGERPLFMWGCHTEYICSCSHACPGA